MPTLRLMRRLANGMPCMLLAALLLFARLVAPAMAMPIDPGDLLAQQTICHTGAPSQPAEPSQPGHIDCLLCPACHLVSPAALPTPAPIVPRPRMVAIVASDPLPPSIGPPSRVLTAAQPTGPPALSA